MPNGIRLHLIVDCFHTNLGLGFVSGKLMYAGLGNAH